MTDSAPRPSMSRPPESPLQRRPLYKSRAFQITVGLLVTAACLAWAFYQMAADDDPRDVVRKIAAAFKQADYRTLPLLWLVLGVFYWIKAWRWRLLLRPLGDFRPVRQLLPPILIGFAFNNLLPARIGEFVRVFVFSRRHRLPPATVLATVALERILDAVAILALFAGAVAMLSDVPEEVRQQALAASLVAGIGVLCISIYLFWTEPFVRFAAWSMDKVPILPRSLRTRIIGVLERGAAGLASLRNGRLLAGILLTSFAQWALNGVLVYLSLVAFSIQLPWSVSYVLLGVVAFGVAVPTTPGYFGVIQVCFLIVLQAFLADKERIFAASIYFHMAQYIPVTLIGMVLFNRVGLRVADVQDAAESPPATSS